MLSLAFALFFSGVLTILLPCILPLVPVVVGVSVAGQSKLRPLMIVLGMLISFVAFTFLLQVTLAQFPEYADFLRLFTYYVLILFGLGFVTHHRMIHIAGAVLASLFFWDKGIVSVVAMAVLGVILMEVGGRVATSIQQFGTDIQSTIRKDIGNEKLLGAFLIGLTLGLVWVPCAGPALGFALTLVRDQPGAKAFFYLFLYALGSAVPLAIVGYGGQAAVRTVRTLTPYTGLIKQISGVILILTAIGLYTNALMRFQLWFTNATGYGDFASRIEESFFKGGSSTASGSTADLPKLAHAPEFTGLGPWHNSQPFTLASLKGKVVLVDFWTYSCINCVRTLPYIVGYWEKYKDQPFVLLGVHTPEFAFEKVEANVSAAIKEHGLTYPVAQDNDYGTWEAFGNHYWPAKYLIDKDGHIRYTHFGEGGYEETDQAIMALLKEVNPNASAASVSSVPAETSGQNRDQSPETYLGERGQAALGNPATSDDAKTYPVMYFAPDATALNKFYLQGMWQIMDGEYQLLRSETGGIYMKWLGSEINLVLGLQEGAKPVTGEVWIDGKKVKDITVDRHDLYNLYSGDYGEHDLVLKFGAKGVEGYAFTFGSK